MRCLCILLSGSGPGARIHVFGYASDLERAGLLYTSVLIQMWHGLAAAPMPEWCRSPRAWRRSWLLGFATAVISRVRAAEQAAARQATAPAAEASSKAALVLADRTLVIRRTAELAYPVTRTAKVTYSGTGYGAGYAQGQRADLGGARLPAAGSRALGGGGR
jgi:hypothetical protein